VCKIWSNDLENKMLKKILFPTLKNITLFESFNLNFKPRVIMNVGNNIYINNNSNVCKFNVESSELIKINNIDENYNFKPTYIITIIKSHRTFMK
jgi:hypothetical protein